MASRDRFPPQLELQPAVAPRKQPQPQGELFARLALRPLPLLKGEPEDFWILTERTLH